MDSTIKYLTASETDELFSSILCHKSIHQVRNLAIFRVANYCALRVSEIGKLLVRDYNTSQTQIYCRREKGSNNNTIRIIDSKVQEALDSYLSIRSQRYPSSEFLFISQKGKPISRQMLDKLMKHYCVGTSIPVDKRHFHSLKHTKAVELADRGTSIENIQWWLGHKNISNTQIYTQFTTKQQDALYQFLLNN